MINRKPERLLLGFTLGVAATLILTFQNCSKVELEMAEKVEILSVPVSLKSTICSQARTNQVANQKFIFILDLSASNFGEWTRETIGGRNYHYWDPALATDRDGDRYKAIESFIDECGNQAGNSYALIGFSAGAGTLGASGLNCENPQFMTGAQIKSQLHAIKTREMQDRAWYERWQKPNYLSEQQPDSLIFSVTSYTSATKCLENLVLNDLQKPDNNTTNYRVFFISDGLPQDKRGSGCNLTNLTDQQKQSCYFEKSIGSLTMSRTSAFALNKKLTLQGIFYGDEKIKPEVLDKLSKEGGTSGYKYLRSFKDNNKVLCDFFVSELALEYKPDLYALLNLNVQRHHDRFFIDSDLDGLSDDEEQSLGLDPGNPRSLVSGVLDGVCQRLGGASQCLAARNRMICNADQFDQLGLTDCDRGLLQLARGEAIEETAEDEDGDGILDFIEIIFGSNPKVHDSLIDPDHDGVSHFEELIRGTKGQVNDATFTDKRKMNQFYLHLNPRPESEICPSGAAWEIHSDNLIVADTRGISPALHQALPTHLRLSSGEQLMLGIYRLIPMNSPSPKYEYHFTWFKWNQNDGPLSTWIRPTDYQKLGERRP